jgi:hypothetical protein
MIMKKSGPISGVFKRVSSALRLQGEAAGDPTARTLHLLILMLLCVTATHVTIALIHFYNKLVIIQTGFPIVFTPVITLVLLRRNAVRAARLVYLVGSGWVSRRSCCSTGEFAVSVGRFTSLWRYRLRGCSGTERRCGPRGLRRLHAGRGDL